MQRCPHCNSNVSKKNKFCPECGTAIGLKEESSTKELKAKSLLIIVLLVLIVILLIAVLGSMYFDIGPNLLDETEETVAEETVPTAFSDDPEAISAASKSVVKLECYDKSGELYATGSGFACLASNIIVTNYHVIDGLVYSIKASTEDGHRFDITHILATDEAKDIAILATESAHGLAVLKPGDSTKLQKGEKVVAIGSPLGLLNSVSTGVFSGYVNEEDIDVLQFTASISSGSSGGALFNDAGEVLGVTYASYESGQNLNLAIPIEFVKRLFESREYAITVRKLYQERIGCLTGYDAFLASKFLEFNDLVADPAKYSGMLISVEGYVWDAEDGVSPNPSQIDLIPTKEAVPVATYRVVDFGKFGKYEVVEYGTFNQSNILWCTDSHEYISVEKYDGRYVVITGMFVYNEYNDQASLSIKYIEEV